MTLRTTDGERSRRRDVLRPGSRPHSRPRSRRRLARRVLVGGLVLAALGTWVVVAPVPGLDRIVRTAVTDRVAGQLTCTGSTGAGAPPSTITLGGGGVLPQLIGGRMSEIRLTMPDVALGTIGHAAVETRLSGVRALTSDAPRADAVTAVVTVGFDDLPVPAGLHPRFGRATDGSLTVSVTPTAGSTTSLTGTLFLALELDGETVTAVPQRLQVLGRTLAPEKASALAGGTRSQKLPHLPDGVRYTSVDPRADGLHVTLAGSVTKPLSALPTSNGSLPLTYRTGGGQLGIHTTVMLPGLGSTPLTIFTSPRIDGRTLTFEPRSVEVLGANRPPSDAIAAVVLSQVSPSDLSAELPVLPAGVRYRSVSVTGAGITVTVGGTTVRPFSELGTPDDDQKITYGAQDGLLTATSSGAATSSGTGTGAAAGGAVLLSRPKITGNTLDLSPRTVDVLGIRFPAADVLSRLKGVTTTFALPALGGGLHYTDVEVLPSGLRVHVTGEQVTLSAELFGAARCTAHAAS